MRLARTRVARSLVGRVLLDQLVEGALGVEHHRPQLALHLDACPTPGRRRSLPSSSQAQRVGEALRGVDREHRDLRARGGHAERDRRRRWSSCRRRPSRRRCRPPCPRASGRITAAAPGCVRCARAPRAELGLEQERKGEHRSVARRGAGVRPASARPGRAALLRHRRLHRCARLGRPAAVEAPRRRASAPVKRCGSTAFTTTASSSIPSSSRRRPSRAIRN